uniref:Uncharacterized protein n=1 Tax=Arundo donax TaxID=35708 RepID=A0A0A9A4Z9_ARUDO
MKSLWPPPPPPPPGPGETMRSAVPVPVPFAGLSGRRRTALETASQRKYDVLAPGSRRR